MENKQGSEKEKQIKIIEDTKQDTISYDNINQSYDSLHRTEQYGKYQIIISMIGIKEKDKLLDVACGTGMFFEFLESKNIQCSKQGVDNSKGMIKQCKKKGFDCHFFRAEKLPFSDKIFDVITCVSAIHNFENPENSLQEMKRVCKDSGTIIITLLKRSEKYDKICLLIKKYFKIERIIEEKNDVLFLLRFQDCASI